MSGMKKINQYYRDLLTEHRLEARIWYFEQAFDLIFDKTDGLVLNRDILGIVVRSYFVDIDRMKHLHNIDLIERCKIAAYTIKWISKLRPVCWESTNPTTATKRVLLSNERYALEIGCAMAEIDKSIVTPDFFNESLYLLHYRDVMADNLVHWFSALGGSTKLENG